MGLNGIKMPFSTCVKLHVEQLPGSFKPGCFTALNGHDHRSQL